MATFYSPKIVTDGLVLCLDAANIKSFRGEPTVNVVANPLPTTSWNVSNAQESTITRTFLVEDGQQFMQFTNVTNGQDYPRVTDSVFPNSATITGTFSTSFEARGTPGAQIRLRIYENGSTKITNTVTLTSDWVRYTFENQSTSFLLNQPYFNPVTTGATYDIRNIQIEAKPYATPFVNGTRGTTVATGGGWADMSKSGNNVTLTDSPTYSTDAQGSLIFNGVDTQPILPTAINLNGKNYTVSAWIKRAVVGQTHGILTDLQFGWWGFWIDSSNRLSLQHRRLEDNVNNVLIASSPTIDTTWTHVAGSFNSQVGMRLYINGILVASNQSTVQFTLGAGRGPQYIGQFRNSTAVASNVFNGNIASLLLFDKELSPQEILQNFNATCSRFGV
jgi:hypothetical protein